MEQSANFPGREFTSNAFLRRVSSLAFRAASRARAAINALSNIFFVSAGFSSKYSFKPSVTIESTMPRTSELPSFVFVCPSNCGSRILSDNTQVKPSRTSSPDKLASFAFSTFCRRAKSFAARVNASLKPAKCVPPSSVFILFTKL